MRQRLPSEPRFTYGDYLHWTDDHRWELIDGQARMMSPAPTLLHQRLVGKLYRQIDEFLDDKPCQAFVAPFDVRLPEKDQADEKVNTVVQPDISVFCHPERLDHRGGRGAPDWIIEILSPGTAIQDCIRKRDLYARHGVAEYWIVDPDSRIVQIYRQSSEAGYRSGREERARGQTEVGLFPDLALDWTRAFGD